MRIVMATETFLPHVDGIVTRLTQTITHLRRMGDEVLILAPRRKEAAITDYEGARVITLPSVRLPQYPDVRLGRPLLPPRIQEEILAFKPDLVHVASTAFLGLGPVLWAHNHKVPLVESYHVQYTQYMHHYKLGVLVPPVWWYLRTVHNLAQLNLATSLPMVRDLRAHGFRHMHLWRPGVDAERFTPTKKSVEMRERLSEGHPDDFLIICVSRLAIEKELSRLAPVLRNLPGVRLALVGGGPAYGRLKGIFEGLPANFVGVLRGDDLAQAYASADVFVLPSSTETLGLVALEAMAAGVPAVVANRGGLPDLVIDGQTGYLFDPDVPTDLIARVDALRKNRDLLAQMAATARDHAERFSWAQTTRQLRGYYDMVLQRFPDPPLSETELEMPVPAGDEL